MIDKRCKHDGGNYLKDDFACFSGVMESLENDQSKCKRKFHSEDFKLLVIEANNHLDFFVVAHQSITESNALWKDHSSSWETSYCITVTFSLIQCILGVKK